MTLTIIARNPYLGQIGVAMASGSDDCMGGSLAMKEGVGIVSVQGKGNLTQAETALQRMEQGMPAHEILARMYAEDGMMDLRQVLIAPVQGDFAVTTGAMCIEQAKHILRPHCIIAGNMLLSEETPEVMEKAYLADMHAPMRRRLLAAIQAGVRAGGDVRGHKSAGVITLGYQPFDVRVTQSDQPVTELSEALR